MLHLIPAPLHRAALRLAHSLRTAWWRIARPQIVGVTILARDPQGRVLLVRHSYGSRLWTLPGGGLRKGEDPALCAAREFREELGGEAGQFTLLGTHEGRLHGSPCRTHVFACRVTGALRPDGREIAEIRFFAPDALPEDAGSRVAVGMELLQQR